VHFKSGAYFTTESTEATEHFYEREKQEIK
jgi:hypothetical protein